MLASEFINTMAFGMLYGTSGNAEGMKRAYEHKLFWLPRLYCNDGFNISVQCHKGNYCGSENGSSTFGLNWLFVEWGFPSEPIDAEKFNSEDYDTTDSVGRVEVSLINELCEEHGGLDLQKTLEVYLERDNMRVESSL